MLDHPVKPMRAADSAGMKERIDHFFDKYWKYAA